MKKIPIEKLLRSRKKIILLKHLTKEHDWIINLTHLAKKTHLDKSTISKLLQELEHQHLIHIQRQGKRLIFKLTNDARAYLQKLFQLQP